MKRARIRIEYGKIRSISPYSVQMQESKNQENSEYEHFLRCIFLSLRYTSNFYLIL